jgi:hypothetical protein
MLTMLGVRNYMVREITKLEVPRSIDSTWYEEPIGLGISWLVVPEPGIDLVKII